MKPVLAFCAVAALTGGCARVTVSVNAFADPSAPAALRYVVLPADEAIRTDDLEFREYAGYARRALARQGFTEATSLDQAGLVVLMRYGMSEPRRVVTSVQRPAFRHSWGFGYGFGYGRHGYFAEYDTLIETRTVYSYSLQLSAGDAETYRRRRELKELWRVTAEASDGRGDPRAIMPYLVVAAAPYAGRDTGRAVTVRLKRERETIAPLLPDGPKLNRKP